MAVYRLKSPNLERCQGSDSGSSSRRRSLHGLHCHSAVGVHRGRRTKTGKPEDDTGTTLKKLRAEVNSWLEMAETYRDLITTVSVSPPAIIPGARMYWDSYNDHPQVRAWHGEILSARRLTELYIHENSDVVTL